MTQFNPRHLARTAVLMLMLASLFEAPAAAQQYPRFTGERLYRVSTEDTGYGPAIERIRQVEREAPETYYLVVASSTGPGSTATRDYTDELYQRWRAQARASGKALDPDRHVIIVIGVQNRQISVHAGVRLQNDLGFTGSTIDTEVVQPVFIPHAKAGEYAQGASALVDAIHRWLRRKEASLAQVRRARQQLRREQQAALAAGLRQERAAAEQLSSRVVQAGREGLATGELERAVQGLGPLFRQAETLASEQPEAASASLKKARASRLELQTRLAGLQTLRSQAREAHVRASQAWERAGQEVRRGQAAGLLLDDLATAQQRARERLDQAGLLLTSDYTQALSLSAGVESQASETHRAVGERERHREAERRRHRFVTRTLPAAGALTLVAAAILLIVVLRVSHLRLKGTVNAQLEGLLKELVRCMERLEALTERHKLLLGADADFTAPIAGKTLALYEQTEEVLRKAWGVWDQLVASRDAIRGLIAQQSPLGRKGLEAARSRLDELQRSRELSTLLDAVETALDRLNAAHESAQAALETLKAEIERASERLGRLETSGLSREPYASSRQGAERTAAGAVARYEADPLASRAVAEAGSTAATDWNGWMERVLHGAAEHAAATERAQRLADLANVRRSEGYLLAEPVGNPDPPLADARTALEKAWAYLQAGADAPAGEALGAAAELLGQGEAAIEGQVRGRAFCDQDLPARRAETQRLHAHLGQAASAREALTREFARSCWSGVEDNCASAEVALAEFDRVCREAERRMHPETQHYQAAQAMLQEVARGQAATGAALTSVEQTLTNLRALRSRVQSDLLRVQELDRTVDSYVAANNPSVRAGTRQRFVGGRAARDATADAAALQPPDWVTAARQLQEAEALLTAAFVAAQEDVAAHRRVLEQLASAERAYSTADEFLRRETADRPTAAHRLGQSHRLLEEARDAAQIAGADWPTLETQLGQAADMANSAMEMAREDVRLLDRARSELRSAELALHSADRYFGHGIRGETGQASNMLGQAASALEVQRYEDVVRLAAEAVMLAQAAQRAAEARVRQIEDEIRRRREEEERRRREAEERRRREAQEAEERRRSSSSSSSFSSGSSSSSYSSGTSQSSW